MSADGVYPLSTQDGQAIPLDIVKPSALIFWNLAATVERTVTIPAGFDVCYVFSTTNCLIHNNVTSFGTPVEDHVYPDSALVLANTILILNFVPGANRRIYPLGNGVIYLSAFQQWGALTQQLQTRIG